MLLSQHGKLGFNPQEPFSPIVEIVDTKLAQIGCEEP